MGRLRILAALVAAAALLPACGKTPGLGRGACPYVRPRLIRLDTDKLHLPGSLPDIKAVSEDIGDFVSTNLPNGGKDKGDQVLVRFSAALDRYVAGGATGNATLAPAEAALEHECKVNGY
jgi:hypothetical protein